MREGYHSFAELEAACEEAMNRFNAREHRETRRAPGEAIVDERLRLHPVPALAHTLAFGQDRAVDRDATIRYGSARYSVPHTLIGEKVWARVSGEELVVVDAAPAPARSPATSSQRRATPGSQTSTIPSAPLIRSPRAPARRRRPNGRSSPSAMARGSGSSKPPPGGTQRVRSKMTEATELAALVGSDIVDRALGLAAASGRFGTGDLSSIVDYLATGQASSEALAVADPDRNLSTGTHAWEGLGR